MEQPLDPQPDEHIGLKGMFTVTVCASYAKDEVATPAGALAEFMQDVDPACHFVASVKDEDTGETVEINSEDLEGNSESQADKNSR